MALSPFAFTQMRLAVALLLLVFRPLQALTEFNQPSTDAEIPSLGLFRKGLTIRAPTFELSKIAALRHQLGVPTWKRTYGQPLRHRNVILLVPWSPSNSVSGTHQQPPRGNVAHLQRPTDKDDFKAEISGRSVEGRPQGISQTSVSDDLERKTDTFASDNDLVRLRVGKLYAVSSQSNEIPGRTTSDKSSRSVSKAKPIFQTEHTNSNDDVTEYEKRLNNEDKEPQWVTLDAANSKSGHGISKDQHGLDWIYNKHEENGREDGRVIRKDVVNLLSRLIHKRSEKVANKYLTGELGNQISQSNFARNLTTDSTYNGSDSSPFALSAIGSRGSSRLGEILHVILILKSIQSPPASTSVFNSASNTMFISEMKPSLPRLPLPIKVSTLVGWTPTSHMRSLSPRTASHSQRTSQNKDIMQNQNDRRTLGFPGYLATKLSHQVDGISSTSTRDTDVTSVSKRRSLAWCHRRRVDLDILLEFFRTGKMCGANIVRLRFGLGRRR